MAQRPVDPAARRRTTSSTGCGRSSRPSSPPAGSTGCRPTTSCAPSLPIVQERLPTLGAIGDLVGFLWVDDARRSTRRLLVPKRWDAATTLAGLDGGARRRSPRPSGELAFEADELEPPLRGLAEARGWKAGDLFMAIRVAVTGRTATPPLFDTLVALGGSASHGSTRRARILRRWTHSTRGGTDDPRRGPALARPITSRPGGATTAEAIGDLFGDDAEYRYHPWDEPVIGRDAIVADWLERTRTKPATWSGKLRRRGAFDGEPGGRDRREPLHEAGRLVPDAVLQPLRRCASTATAECVDFVEYSELMELAARRPRAELADPGAVADGAGHATAARPPIGPLTRVVS